MAGRDVIEVLEHDHREVEEMFAQFDATTDPERRKTIVEQVTIELVRHSVAEEEHVYPAAKQALADGSDRIRDALTGRGKD